MVEGLSVQDDVSRRYKQNKGSYREGADRPEIIQQLKQDGSRVKQRGERRSLARSGGICGPFELESDTGGTRVVGFRDE
jgi:hypothetical protein